MKARPSAQIADFFERYVCGREELILTMKSDSASINIDGPFQHTVFTWSDTDTEVVLSPTYAKPRGNENTVHLHVSWDDELLVRLAYFGAPKIRQDLRICFFKANPPPADRRDELFWFYAFQAGKLRHPLCDRLPARTGSKYSEPMRVTEVP